MTLTSAETDETPARLLHLTLLAVNFPEAHSFPWDEFEYLQKRAIERLLSYTRHYSEWVDCLDIATHQGSISITEAMLLASCPSKDLSRVLESDGHLEIDSRAYDSPDLVPSGTLSYFGLAWDSLATMCREATGCDFHLIDVRRDWWVAPLELAYEGPKAKSYRQNDNATYTAARDQLIQMFMEPLNSTTMNKLYDLVTSKVVSLFTVLRLLASNARSVDVRPLLMEGAITKCTGANEKMMPPPFDEECTVIDFLKSMLLVPQETQTLPSMTEVDKYLTELWRLLRKQKSYTGGCTTSEALRLVSILETQLEAARSLARILKLKIERTWWYSSTANMRYRLFLPTDLRAALSSHADWSKDIEEGFKPAIPSFTTLVMSACHDLDTDAGPSRLIKLIKCNYLPLDAAFWLLLLWSQGSDRAYRAIGDYSVFPNLRLMASAAKGLECLNSVSRFLRVDERQKWMPICKDLRDFLLTPEMEEMAMIETLYLAPFGISHMVSGRVMKQRSVNSGKGYLSPAYLFRQHLTTWHLMGTYVLNMLPYELKHHDHCQIRLWMPLRGSIAVARRTWGANSLYDTRELKTDLHWKWFCQGSLSSYEDLDRSSSFCLSLVPFAVKAFLSDADVRRRAVDVQDHTIFPFDVYEQGLKDGDMCFWVSKNDTCFSTPLNPHERRHARNLILRNHEVFDLEPDVWWIPESERVETSRRKYSTKVAASDDDSADEIIKAGCLRIHHTQRRRLENWYNEQLNDMRQKGKGSIWYSSGTMRDLLNAEATDYTKEPLERRERKMWWEDPNVYPKCIISGKVVAPTSSGRYPSI